MTKTKQLTISLIYFVVFSWVVGVWGVTSPDPYSYKKTETQLTRISYFIHQSKNKDINQKISSILDEVIDMADQGKDFNNYLNSQKLFDNIIIKKIILEDLIKQLNQKENEIDRLTNKYNELLMKIDNYTIRNNHKKQVKERDYTLFDELYYGIFGVNFDLEKFKFHFQEKYNIISFILIWLFFLTKISKRFNKIFDSIILIILWIGSYIIIALSFSFKLVSTIIHGIVLLFEFVGWGFKDIKTILNRAYNKITNKTNSFDNRYWEEKRAKEQRVKR
jgi:hypothetical protein